MATTKFSVAAQQNMVVDFLALPVEALPSARFAVEDDAWSGDAWAVLREIATSGETAEEACGSRIVVRADRDGWRDGKEVR